MMNEENNLKYQLHYYFDDDSHSMDAFVRNKAEKEFLEFVKHISNILELEVSIETEAYEEGGLIETWNLVAVGGTILGVLKIFSPFLNNYFQHIFIKDKIKEAIEKEKLKSLELDNKSKDLDNDKKELELRIEKDKYIKRKVSNFYSIIDKYDKIQKVGFKDIQRDKKEHIVEKKDFKKFILEEEKDIEIDDNAIIEIISPILNNGKDKWKGIYLGNKISFSMGDSKFKKEVIEGKYKFTHGSYIECKLEINITYDEFGDELKKTYSVKKVYSFQETTIKNKIITENGKKKEKDKKQRTLF